MNWDEIYISQILFQFVIVIYLVYFTSPVDFYNASNIASKYTWVLLIKTIILFIVDAFFYLDIVVKIQQKEDAKLKYLLFFLILLL